MNYTTRAGSARLAATLCLTALIATERSEAWNALDMARDVWQNTFSDYIPSPPFIGCTIRGWPIKSDLLERVASLLRYAEIEEEG